MAKNDPKKDDRENVPDLSAMLGMGGILDGVSNLINKFGDLAERGEHLRKSMGNAESKAKPIQTSGGFTVRFGGLSGAAGDASNVMPVNTASTPAQSSRKSAKAPDVPKERTANVEVFEEDDYLLLLAEMPGVASDDVDLSFEDKSLRIEGTSKTANFKAQVDLPRTYTPDQVSINANNGVIEIRLAGSK